MLPRGPNLSDPCLTSYHRPRFLVYSVRVQVRLYPGNRMKVLPLNAGLLCTTATSDCGRDGRDADHATSKQVQTPPLQSGSATHSANINISVRSDHCLSTLRPHHPCRISTRTTTKMFKGRSQRTGQPRSDGRSHSIGAWYVARYVPPIIAPPNSKDPRRLRAQRRRGTGVEMPRREMQPNPPGIYQGSHSGWDGNVSNLDYWVGPLGVQPPWRARERC